MKTVQSKLSPIAAAVAALTMLPLQASNAAVPGLDCDASRCLLDVSNTLSFEVSADGVFEGFDAIEMTGEVTVHTPAQSLRLLQANLWFTYTGEGPVPFELVGTAVPPMADLPLFGQASLHSQPIAAVGLAGRETLKSLLEDGDYSLPLAENPEDPDGYSNDLIEPAYLFFHAETGLALDIPLGDWIGFDQGDDAHDPFAFSVPGDKSVTFILDPAEPYFLLSQDARAMVMDALDDRYQEARARAEAQEEERRGEADAADAGPAGDQNGGQAGQDEPRTDNGADDPDRDRADDQKDGGSLLPELGELAFSWMGGIPFEPATTWGLPADFGRFNGHIYLDATVPLYKFIELTGTVVTHTSEDGFEQGGNGEVEVSFDLIPNLLSFSFPLGNASAGVRVTDRDVMSYFSGLNAPDVSFLPPIIPVIPSNATRVAGYISSANPSDSRLVAHGSFGYDMSGFRALTGLDLRDLQLSEAELEITADGVWLQGRTAVSIHPSISLGGEAMVQIYFSPRSPADSFVDISGNMLVLGVGLEPVRLRVDRTGLFVEGAFVTPISTIAMDGQITSSGPRLAGYARVDFSLGDLDAAIEAARDALIRAQAEVERLNLLVDHNRGVVTAERDKHAAALSEARAAVASAQDRLNGLGSAISGHHRAISSYHSQISAKYRWYKGQHWTKKAWAWTVYTGYRAAKNAQIAWRYTQIGSLEVAKAVAIGALEIAKGALAGLEKATVLVPVDLDPRVAGPLAALHTARIVLRTAEAALPDLPDIDAKISGLVNLGLDTSGMHGQLQVDANGLQLANGRLRFGTRPEACIDVAKLGSLCTPF